MYNRMGRIKRRKSEFDILSGYYIMEEKQKEAAYGSVL